MLFSCFKDVAVLKGQELGTK